MNIFRYGQIVATPGFEERQQLVDHGLIGTLRSPHETERKPVKSRMISTGYKGRLHRYELISPKESEAADILQLMDYYIPAGER